MLVAHRVKSRMQRTFWVEVGVHLAVPVESALSVPYALPMVTSTQGMGGVRPLVRANHITGPWL